MRQTSKRLYRPEYTTRVRVVFSPYKHEDVNIMLRKVQQEFGMHGERWYMRVPEKEVEEVNSWSVEFCFSEPKDATYFKLKYVNA